SGRWCGTISPPNAATIRNPAPGTMAHDLAADARAGVCRRSGAGLGHLRPGAGVPAADLVAASVSDVLLFERRASWPLFVAWRTEKRGFGEWHRADGFGKTVCGLDVPTNRIAVSSEPVVMCRNCRPEPRPEAA